MSEGNRYERFGDENHFIEVTQYLHRGEEVELDIDLYEESSMIYMKKDEAIKFALNILKVCNYEGEMK